MNFEVDVARVRWRREKKNDFRYRASKNELNQSFNDIHSKSEDEMDQSEKVLRNIQSLDEWYIWYFVNQ